MITLTATIPPYPLWVPAEAQQALYELVRGTVNLILTDLAGRISEHAPVGISGHLGQSFTANPATSIGGVEVVGGATPEIDIQGRVFSALPYAIVIDQGRRPGSPISREGIDAIGLWAQRKLGMTEGQAKVAKWAIATKIIQRGITPRNFIQAAFDSGQAQWQKMLDDLAADIAAALVTPGGASGGGVAGSSDAWKNQPRDRAGRFTKRK